MTHASRDTTTGLKFEDYIQLAHNGINLTKHNLYRYLESKKLDYMSVISRKLLPDEAYLDNNFLYVYEKKFQQTDGSADEKPQTCGFKIWEFRKIAKLLGLDGVSYTYILSDWFKQDKYRDMLEYIRSIDGCDYMFEEDINGTK